MGEASSSPVVAPVEDVPVVVKGEAPKDQMDDLEFWLTDAKAPPKEEPKAPPVVVAKGEAPKKTEEEVGKKAEVSSKTESPATKQKVGSTVPVWGGRGVRRGRGAQWYVYGGRGMYSGVWEEGCGQWYEEGGVVCGGER